jgi:hypothetical protein
MTTSHDEMNEYPALKIYTRLLYAVGMLFYAFGILSIGIILLLVAVKIFTTQANPTDLLIAALSMFAAAILCAVVGLVCFLGRELIIVFVRIERNTR